MKTENTIISKSLYAVLAFVMAAASVYVSMSQLILIPLILCLGFMAYTSYDSFAGSKFFLLSLSLAVLVLFVYQSIITTVPNDFDFSCFYLYGTVGARGLDFYNPLEFAKLADSNILPHAITNEFRREVIDVGCPYPPPSIFLFIPLGHMNYQTALVAWKIGHTLIALASVLLIQNIFFPGKAIQHYAIAASFFLLAKPTLDTVLFSQTVFLLFFLVILSYKYRTRLWGGIFLALAIFIKPFSIVLLLWFILSKYWKSFWGFTIACVVIFVATVSFTGIDPFFEYLLNNPALRQPLWLFNEATNQSSLATLLRSFPENKELATQLYYLLNAIIMVVAISFLIIKRHAEQFTDLAWVTLMSVMLIFYPSGQLFYNLIHLISLFILLKYLKEELFKVLLVLAFFTMQYKGLFFTSSFMFLSTLFIGFKLEPYILRFDPIRRLSDRASSFLSSPKG